MTELEKAHARIEELEAQEVELCTLYGIAQAENGKLRAELEAIGAGGVNGPLMTPAPTSGAADLSAIISGALFDFAGFLTTLDKSRAVTFSGAHEAGPAVTLLQEWSTKRGLKLDDANVFDWSAALTAQAPSQLGGFSAGDMASAAAQGFRDGLAAAQADSQQAVAPDERDDFEKVFPLPSGCIRVGTGYASTGYSNWAAHTHCERWQGWQARAARAPADSVTAPAGGVVAAGRFMDEAAERRSAQEGYENRIRRVSERNPHDEGMYSLGWWDRAWKAAAPTSPAQPADSVLEDAARESEYLRGYRQGYEQRDAEVRGALV